MKKLLAVLLAVVLIFALAGCSFIYTEDTAGTATGAAADAATDTTTDAAATGTNTATGMGSMDLFTWFQLALAVYLLYATIVGKGKLFENKYTKCEYEVYRRNMRILCGIAGVLLVATNLLELLDVVEEGTTLGWICWGVGLLSIVAVLVYNIVMTDRKAMAAARDEEVAQQRSASHDPLRAAFVFDDEDEDAKDAPAEESAPELSDRDDTQK